MSNRQRTHSPPPDRPVLDHYRALELGCRTSGIGSVTVWRSIKAVSQLVVLSFAFWGALSGTINPQLAFAGMILVYLGAEGAEAVLAAAGRASFDVTYPNADDGEDRDAETDGGRIVEARPTEDTNT